MIVVRIIGNWLRRCFDCGYVLARKQRICPRCGARQRPERAHPAAACRGRAHHHD